VYVAELTKRRYRGKIPKTIRGPDDVAAVIGRRLRKEAREHFLVLILNARHEVIGKETVSVGSLNASIVHPHEVFKPAILASAASVILVHNHPRAIPSRARRTSRSRSGWSKRASCHCDRGKCL
jgi:DNA repair protein RadC